MNSSQVTIEAPKSNNQRELMENDSSKTHHHSERGHLLENLDSADWTVAHWKAVLVAGSGFLTDSYDNFVISLMVPMIALVYYNNTALEAGSDGWIKAASSYGNLFGQLIFGTLGDLFGRKSVYGIELIILIIGALGCALAAQPVTPGGLSIIPIISFWRFILGFGVGGDYPISAVITSEFSNRKNRGMMLAIVFAMQGFGILLGAIVAVAVTATLKNDINSNVLNLDYAWRILAAFGAVPALCAVYFRLTITETPRFTMEVEGNTAQAVSDTRSYLSGQRATLAPTLPVVKKNASHKTRVWFTRFTTYFGEWKNAKILFATSACWFLLDIGYYGTNLNTSVVLSAINYSDKSSPYRYIWTTCVGQLIIACAGNVPGFWFTVAFVEPWGRKPIQLMGFFMLSLIFAILGGFYTTLKTNSPGAFVTLYALAQFFFNFGPNTTTFIYPAEIYPTAVRSTAHGISAASGKMGALIAAQLFSLVADVGGPAGKKTFMAGTLGIFSGVCFLGFLITFLLPETKGLKLEDLADINDDYRKESEESVETKDAFLA